MDDFTKEFQNYVKRSPISREEEQELLQRIEQGDKEARDKLITGNLWLVKKMACKYVCRGVKLPDLMQAGTQGLIEALNKFNRKRGNRFFTYAAYQVHSRIVKAVSFQKQIVHVPRKVRDHWSTIDRACDYIRSKEGVDKPTPFQIAERIGLKPNKVDELIKLRSCLLVLSPEHMEETRPDHTQDNLPEAIEVCRLFGCKRLEDLRDFMDGKHDVFTDREIMKSAMTSNHITTITQKKLALYTMCDPLYKRELLLRTSSDSEDRPLF